MRSTSASERMKINPVTASGIRKSRPAERSQMTIGSAINVLKAVESGSGDREGCVKIVSSHLIASAIPIWFAVGCECRPTRLEDQLFWSCAASTARENAGVSSIWVNEFGHLEHVHRLNPSVWAIIAVSTSGRFVRMAEVDRFSVSVRSWGKMVCRGGCNCE